MTPAETTIKEPVAWRCSNDDWPNPVFAEIEPLGKVDHVQPLALHEDYVAEKTRAEKAEATLSASQKREAMLYEIINTHDALAKIAALTAAAQEAVNAAQRELNSFNTMTVFFTLEDIRDKLLAALTEKTS